MSFSKAESLCIPGGHLPTIWAVEAAIVQYPAGWHLGLPLGTDFAHHSLLHGGARELCPWSTKKAAARDWMKYAQRQTCRHKWRMVEDLHGPTLEASQDIVKENQKNVRRLDWQHAESHRAISNASAAMEIPRVPGVLVWGKPLKHLQMDFLGTLYCLQQLWIIKWGGVHRESMCQLMCLFLEPRSQHSWGRLHGGKYAGLSLPVRQSTILLQDVLK